jgi:predicted transcriptional regulator
MPGQDTDAIETAVIMGVLGRDRGVSLIELYARLDAGESEIADAVNRLGEAGVIRRDTDGSLHGSTALRCLDRLGLIGV